MSESLKTNSHYTLANSNGVYRSADQRELDGVLALTVETARLADAQETANMLKVLELRFTAVSIGRIGNDDLAEKILERMGL